MKSGEKQAIVLTTVMSCHQFSATVSVVAAVACKPLFVVYLFRGPWRVVEALICQGQLGAKSFI